MIVVVRSTWHTMQHSRHALRAVPRWEIRNVSARRDLNESSAQFSRLNFTAFNKRATSTVSLCVCVYACVCVCVLVTRTCTCRRRHYCLVLLPSALFCRLLWLAAISRCKYTCCFFTNVICCICPEIHFTSVLQRNLFTVCFGGCVLSKKYICCILWKCIVMY